MNDHWLVRTKDNIIAGPYTGDQIRKLILESQLGYQDEICQGNHYWIFVHERHEVKKQLGIDVPKPKKGSADEVTETETQTETETVLELDQDSMAVAAGEDDGLTRVGSMMAKPKAQAAAAGKKPAVAPTAAPPEPRPALDRRSSPAQVVGVRSARDASHSNRKWILIGAAVVAAIVLYKLFLA
ncbi:MAG: hypothetical protein IT285_06635 [Bdellovibrionales bacterium]|nr:hypothetical protein [Bdellovibrionales bacterium]